MSRLAELLDVSFSNATGIIDRMEERGLVERVRVPDDRRVVLVRIGPRGIQALDETEAIKHDRLDGDPRPISTRPRSTAWRAALDDIRAAVIAEFGPDFVGHDHTHHREPKEGASI